MTIIRTWRGYSVACGCCRAIHFLVAWRVTFIKTKSANDIRSISTCWRLALSCITGGSCGKTFGRCRMLSVSPYNVSIRKAHHVRTWVGRRVLDNCRFPTQGSGIFNKNLLIFDKMGKILFSGMFIELLLLYTLTFH